VRRFQWPLPTWFIKLFTRPGDIVLDPFVGSGTTALAAKQLGRHYVGIDISEEYCEIAETRVMQMQPMLLDERTTYDVRPDNESTMS